MAIKKWGSGKGFQISVEGFEITTKTLSLSKNQRNRLEAFIQKECDKIIDHAQEIVPYDEGDLHDTHRREKVTANKQGVIYRVVVGGKSGPNKFVDYAEKVHENEPWLKEASDYELIGFRDRAIRRLRWITGRGEVPVVR